MVLLNLYLKLQQLLKNPYRKMKKLLLNLFLTVLLSLYLSQYHQRNQKIKFKILHLHFNLASIAIQLLMFKILRLNFNLASITIRLLKNLKITLKIINLNLLLALIISHLLEGKKHKDLLHLTFQRLPLLETNILLEMLNNKMILRQIQKQNLLRLQKIQAL